MSDFSVIHKKYNSISNLTNELNNSVIVLKRRNMVADPKVRKTHPKLQVQEDEIAKANQDITDILTALEAFYAKPETTSSLYELMDNLLFKKFILENVEYKQNILQSLEKLKALKHLNNKELSGIDKFISILDNEASVLYRKLRSTRG